MGLNKPVDFTTAKLLKEKGVIKNTEANWWILAKDHSDNYKKGLPVDETKIFFAANHRELSLKTQIDEDREHNVYHVLSVPTIAEVVMWLYEKYGIWVVVDNLIDNKFYFSHRDTKTNNYASRSGCNEEGYESPTEAYEAAILYTLNNLI